jgi:molybdenum cofactor biosynthesis protein B
MSDPVAEHRAYAPDRVAFGVVTVSSSRTLDDDDSGRRIEELAVAAGMKVAERLIVDDEVAAIRGVLQALLSRDDVDAIVVNGGTGYSPGDVTPEAVHSVLDEEIPGFGELFRVLSYQEIGAAAMLSRAFAGVAHGRPVFVLPGSPKAVTLAMETLILPEVAHLLGQLRRDDGGKGEREG